MSNSSSGPTGVRYFDVEVDDDGDGQIASFVIAFDLLGDAPPRVMTDQEAWEEHLRNRGPEH